MTTPALSTLAQRVLEDLPEGPILVAVSGGPDSMALLSVLARHAGPKRPVLAHGIDHGLRPEAAAELDVAETFARKLGVPFARTRVVVEPGSNLQAKARSVRWAALVGVARQHSASIAAAHHADDRAETVLIRLLRGSGLRGLGVLPPIAPVPGNDVVVVRPFIHARRADILRYVARHEIPCVQDPSNSDPRYMRTRVRDRLIPLLLELDPRIVEHLNDVADELCAGAREGGDGSLDWARGLPRPTQKAISALIQSRSPTTKVWLPDGLVVMVDTKRRES